MLTSVLTWKDRKHPSALLAAVRRANKRVEFLKPKVKVCPPGGTPVVVKKHREGQKPLATPLVYTHFSAFSFLLVSDFPDFPDFPDLGTLSGLTVSLPGVLKHSFHFARSSQGIPARLQP